MRIQSSEPEVGFCSDDEEGHQQMEGIQTSEVQIATIHDIEGAGFDDELVEDSDIVELAVGDSEERGNGSFQVEQRVQLDGPLVLSESGPREKGKTQIDGGGVEGIGRFVQIGDEAVVSIEILGDANQHVCKVGKDAPISVVVGVRQCASGNPAADSHVIELGGLCSQTGLDIPQTFPVSQLGKGQAEKLIQRGETLGLVIAVIPFDTATKFV